VQIDRQTRQRQAKAARRFRPGAHLQVSARIRRLLQALTRTMTICACGWPPVAGRVLARNTAWKTAAGRRKRSAQRL